jgi:hypothetical protein
MQEDVEVSFCDLCGTSVPAGDLATGAAVRHQGKTIGGCCLPGLRAEAPAAVAPAVVRPSAPAEVRILPAAIVVLAAIAAATLFLEQRVTSSDAANRAAIDKLAEAQASDSQVLASLAVNMDAVPRRADHDAVVAKIDEVAAAAAKALGEQRKQLDALAADLAAVSSEQRTLAGKVIDYRPLIEDVRDRQVRLVDLIATLRAVAPVAENQPIPAPAAKQPEEASAPPALSPALVEALKKLQSQDPAVRFEAADVLLRSKEASVLPQLAPLARDPDRFVRSLIVDGLRAWKRPEAVEALLQALADADENVRDMAWRSLKEVTGQKLPFESNGSKDARARAIQKWQEWWDKNKATFGA